MPSEVFQPTDAKVKRSKTSFATQDIVYLMVFGGAFFYAIAWKFSEGTSVWLQILFSLPVVAQLIGGAFHIRRARTEEEHWFFYNFSMWSSTTFIAAYCVLWILYSNGYKSYRLLSWLALLTVTALICLVGYMMCAFLQVPDREKWPNLTGLRNGAAAEPLWAMSFLFFVLFLDVTFLFGFAFAFHDQYFLSIRSDTPALRMLNLDSPDTVSIYSKADIPKGNGKVGQHADSGVNDNGAISVAPTVGPGGLIRTGYHFYFDSSQAALDRGLYEEKTTEAVKKEVSENGKASSTANQDIEVARRVINAECEISDDDPSPLKRSIWVTRDFKLNNFCSLEQLKRRLERDTNEGKRTRVILVGRADDKPINGGRRVNQNDDLQRYKSNYELSEARVQNIRYEIVEALKKQDDTEAWHNLEWLSLPSSNENSTSDPELEKILQSQPGLPPNLMKELRERNKRVVVATIVAIPNDITSLQMKQLNRSQFKEMTLMDYMYFSIYTITTTGYGDIIPTTAYSKFVISVANICEVLFLVVFFNALVSIKRENRNELQDLVDFVRDQKDKRGSVVVNAPSGEAVPQEVAE
jgi:type II secretory pathway predicted ATPase ExeA